MKTFLTVAFLFYGALLAQGKADPREAELRKHLKENFGMPGYETIWYKVIKSVKIEGATVVAQIDRPTASAGVCSGISGYVFDRTAKHGLTGLTIIDATGKTLVARKSVADRCQ